MKNSLAVLIVLTISFQNLNAQKFKTSQDSSRAFYKEILKVMKKGYLYKDSVNWSELEAKVDQNISNYPDFNTSLKEVTTIFDTAAADHCKVYYNNLEFACSYDGPSGDDFSEQWLKKFATKPVFEVKLLDEQYGYILMPAMSFEDGRKEPMHLISQPMYDAINDLKNSKDIKGWVIDLRFNTGGDCMPMLLALYDFLGDNEIWGELDLNGKRVSTIKLKNGKYIADSKIISYINPKGAVLDNAKVAILTNIATGSSGEITAMSFKGRDNTIFIGDNSNGKTTTNYAKELPFGAYMTLTQGYDCDRNGNFYKKIIPDVVVSKQDNFENMLLDGNIIEAIKYFEGI